MGDSILQTGMSELGSAVGGAASSKANSAVSSVSDSISGALGPSVKNGQYLTIQQFSTEFLDTIANLTINAGDAFLNGTATSIFTDERDVQQLDHALDSTFKATANVLDATQQLKNTDYKALGDQAAALAKATPKILSELTTNAVKSVTKELTLYTVSKLAQIMDPGVVVGAITNYTTYYMQMGLAASANMLKEIMTPQDKALQDSADAEAEAKKNEKIEKLEKKVSDMKEATTIVVSDIKNGIQTIMPYVRKGPQVLLDMANAYIDYGVNIAKSYIDYGANTVIMYRDATIESIGEYIGDCMAESINKTTKKLLGKQVEEAKVAVNVVMYKSMGVMMAAVQLVVIQVGPILGKIVKMGVQIGIKQLVKQIPL